MFRKMLFIALTLFLSISTARAAVVWEWDGTTLSGAGNVDVNGTLYDVKFMDGSCVSLFTDCDSADDDFAFTTPGDAGDAAQALLDQVLLNPPFNPLGQGFDFIPGLTAGCSFSSIFCTIFIPHTIPIGGVGLVALAGAENSPLDPDNTVTGDRSINLDLGDVDDEVYAIFTKTAVVPIPAAFWLFGTVLLGLVGFSKRRKAA